MLEFDAMLAHSPGQVVALFDEILKLDEMLDAMLVLYKSDVYQNGWHQE